MKKIRPIKNTCYGWLINYIPELIKKVYVVSNIKLKVFLRQTNPSKLRMGEEKN